MNAITMLASWLLRLAPAFAMALAARRLMQYVQLASYQLGGFARAVLRLPAKSFLPGAALSAAGVILLFLGFLALKAPPALALMLSALLSALLLLVGFVLSLLTYRAKQVKVPLVSTPRVRRLYAALVLLGLLACLLLKWAGLPLVLSALVPLLTPAMVFFAMLLTWPFEKAVQLLYRRDAGRILDTARAEGLRVIGVTGSYGKTTVKNILYAMLSQLAPTLASPASFNTPMGLSRCIREELGQQHRFFIAEMGARHPQDIRVLARMVKPGMGILTSIGPQHLQTMGSITRVRDTKYDLIRALPEDGFAVFGDDGKYVLDCYRKTVIGKALAGSPGSDLWAEDVRLTTSGSAFTLCLRDGRRHAVTTRLTGGHNVQNILLAAAMALHLGLGLERLAQALLEVAPIASRLQASVHRKGYTVINNGFNSNPDSSRKALQVLAAHPGRLIVVTPGFVELGSQERRSNRRLGSDIAAVAQEAVLIGEKHTRPIKAGLLESGMAEGSIHVFPTLASANAFIEETYGLGDVLLYENDLPDHYA